LKGLEHNFKGLIFIMSQALWRHLPFFKWK